MNLLNLKNEEVYINFIVHYNILQGFITKSNDRSNELNLLKKNLLKAFSCSSLNKTFKVKFLANYFKEKHSDLIQLTNRMTSGDTLTTL